MDHIPNSSLEFLKDVKQNNDRKWFNLHKDRYKRVRENFISFCLEVAYGVSLTDTYLKDTQSETHIFRINRDIRFSRNKTPYKTNFLGFISPRGRKSQHLSAGYFLHIEPGNNFIGGGAYLPEKDYLEKIRQKIIKNPKEFKALINHPDRKKQYSPLSTTGKLKIAPKGYPRDHPEIDLLRHKNFTSMIYFTDKEILQKGFQKKVIEKLSLLTPLNNWFNEII